MIGNIDILSRNFNHKTEWMLNRQVFKKTSCKTWEGDIDFMVTFPNTPLQPQSQLLLDMADIEDYISHVLSIPWSNKIYCV